MTGAPGEFKGVIRAVCMMSVCLYVSFAVNQLERIYGNPFTPLPSLHSRTVQRL